MKKSKIIVPALGILCLSTAAAVTGTVAWFTASRLQTIGMEKITVVNPETGLTVNLKNAAACTLDNTNKSVTHGLVGEDQGYLRDGSVDVENDKLYKAVLDDNGSYSAYAEQTFGTADVKGFNNHKVYHATKFVMSFSALNNDPTNVNNCLFFSPNLSSAVMNPADGDIAAATDDAYTSLRIGMKSSDGEWFVWAPFYKSTIGSGEGQTANPLSYINGTVKGTNEQELDATNSITGNATVASAGVESDLNDGNGALVKATAEGLVYYLGVLPADPNATSGATTLDINVYTWFEGTDAYCNEDFWTKLQSGVTASLSFVSRNVLKA